ncbi:MAG: glycine cleavage system protein GcvH, partial [Gammaproteobacteria bacterium]|nr:glycine cleavage system protein GcvH [Gammaproteobacteria bacterium]
RSHEWVRLEDGGRATVGISDHAQEQLGDLVYVELPAVGDRVAQGDACAVVESVKAASDIYAPISGTVVAINEALSDTPDTINSDAFGEGWLFVLEVEDASQLEGLLSPADYATLVDEESN